MKVTVERRGKKGSKFGVPVPVIHGIWGCLLMETSPFDCKRKDLTQKEWSKAISCLLLWKPKTAQEEGPSWSSPKKLAWHVQTYSTIKLEIFFLLSTPTVLIYNHELGVINSSEFFVQKTSRRRVMYSLVF